MKKINWGILAPGRIAHKFAKDLAEVAHAQLHAVASRSPERASDFAKQYGVAFSFGAYEELLTCPDLDIVYIASPHSEHCEHALLCLEAGIPVLCEKPLAANKMQALRMVEAARRKQTFLMEALWTRFIPGFRIALQIIEEGYLGRLHTIRANFGFRAEFPPTHRIFNPSLCGGSLLDVGIYPVFLAVLMWGPPDEVQATVRRYHTGVDASCAMLLKWGNDRLAILDSSVVYHTDTEATLYGDAGTMRLHRRFHHPTEITIEYYDRPSERLYIPYKGFGYTHEIEAVQRCLQHGFKECPELPLSFSLILMETLDRIRESAENIERGSNARPHAVI